MGSEEPETLSLDLAEQIPSQEQQQKPSEVQAEKIRRSLERLRHHPQQQELAEIEEQLKRQLPLLLQQKPAEKEKQPDTSSKSLTLDLYTWLLLQNELSPSSSNLYRLLSESKNPLVTASLSNLSKQLLSQQKSSDLTKDEIRTLMTDTLTETLKAANVLKPDPANVLSVAGSQLQIIKGYYVSVLKQAQRSFFAALIAASIGLIFFIAAVSFLLLERPTSVSVISLIAGSRVEVISGINFYLYARASSQLSTFHARLETTQNFLLANSVCENLDGEVKLQTRAGLVNTIANSLGISQVYPVVKTIMAPK